VRQSRLRDLPHNSIQGNPVQFHERGGIERRYVILSQEKSRLLRRGECHNCSLKEKIRPRVLKRTYVIRPVRGQHGWDLFRSPPCCFRADTFLKGENISCLQRPISGKVTGKEYREGHTAFAATRSRQCRKNLWSYLLFFWPRTGFRLLAIAFPVRGFFVA